MSEKSRRPSNPRLVITMASAEIVPFAKTGGLADVVGALSRVLANSRIKVNLLMPAYRSVMATVLKNDRPSRFFEIPVGNRTVTGQLYQKQIDPFLDAYFIRADEYFDREYLYGDRSGDYPDNAERFAFFSRVILEVAELTMSSIIHLHDWQTAPAAALLKMQLGKYPALSTSRTVLTIHNLCYQGLFGTEHWQSLNLDWQCFNPAFEFWGKINFLKSGLVAADRLTTVSPTYALEIQEPGGGFGLEGVLKERSRDLSGILNGIDYTAWNPETDPVIEKNFSQFNLSGKSDCKRFLQSCYGLPSGPSTPLACLVTRLVGGKGLELVIEAAESILARGIQLVILGKGEPRYENFFCDLVQRHPGQTGIKIAFDEGAAHQVIAGADILLMPSEREPCGLTQMYALRYGTIPIARRTGGLADSVEPYTGYQGTGFVFDHYSGKDFLGCVERALSVYHRKSDWEKLVSRAMAADHSWDNSMGQYIQLYLDLLRV
ncbi:MAG: glycogen synthase GlgA [Dehalogenimonas sp.]